MRHISEMTQYARQTVRRALGALSSRAAPNGDAHSCEQRPTLKRAGKPSMIEPFKEFLLHRIKAGLPRDELLLEARGRGFGGSRETLARFLRGSTTKSITTTERGVNWMHLVLQGAKTSSDIRKDIGDALTENDVTTLLTFVKTRPLKARNRALSLLAHGNRIPNGQIAAFLCISRITVRRYISDFKKGGIQCGLVRTSKGVRKAANPDYAAAVFKTLHAPPSAFGLNRTTWRMQDLHAVLSTQGMPICRGYIHKIIKDAGYTFRKARRVLTSTDPEYREKL